MKPRKASRSSSSVRVFMTIQTVTRVVRERVSAFGNPLRSPVAWRALRNRPIAGDAGADETFHAQCDEYDFDPQPGAQRALRSPAPVGHRAMGKAPVDLRIRVGQPGECENSGLIRLAGHRRRA